MEILKFFITLFAIISLLSCASTPDVNLQKFEPATGKKLPVKVATIISEDYKKLDYTTRIQARCFDKIGSETDNGLINARIEIGPVLSPMFSKGFMQLFDKVDVFKNKSEIPYKHDYDFFLIPSVEVSTSYDEQEARSRKLTEIQSPGSKYRHFYGTPITLSASASYTLVILSADLQTKILELNSSASSMGKSTTEGRCLGNSNANIWGIYHTGFNSSYADLIGTALNDGFIELLKTTESRMASFAANKAQEHALPSELSVTANYSDEGSFLPNKTIDAGEEGFITLSLTNKGKGTAYNVVVLIDSNYKNIEFTKETLIGDILPGELKTIDIPIKANTSLTAGTASILIKTKEKRGYDAQPLELQIAAASIQGPKLAFLSCNLNNSSGLGKGSGDGIPKNNETIQLDPIIKNDGVGEAIKVSVKLSKITEGLEVVKGSDELTSVGVGATSKATLAFRIPRTFNKSEIQYTIAASDVRGIKTEKTYSVPFQSSAPVLYYTYQIVDRNNREISALENGATYSLRVASRNTGSNAAEGVKLRVLPESDKAILGSFNSDIGSIQANSVGSIVSIPLSLKRSFVSPKLDIEIAMTQDAFDGISRKISLPVRVKRPDLIYQVNLLNGVSDKAVSQNSWPRFRVSVSNNGNLDANDVSIKFSVKSRDITFDKEEQTGRIGAGESQFKDFNFFVRGDVSTGDMPVIVDIKQSDFESVSKTLAYQVKEQTAIVQKVKSLKSGDSTVVGVAYAGPPELYINTPNQNSKTIKDTVDLHGNIITFGKGNGLSKLTISLNGKPLTIIPTHEEMRLDPNQITKRQIGEDKFVFDGAIILKHGDNEIGIQSVDFNNQITNQTLKVSRQARLGNIYAVIIGISDFWNKDYNLKFGASDAEKFYKFLKSDKGGALPDDRIKLLTNAQAKRANIISSLTNFLGKSTKDDTVEIYFATHGIMDAQNNLYFLCHDSDLENLRATAFSDKEFTDILNDIGAGKKILYLDACHAGMSGLSGRYAKRGIAIHEVNERLNSLAGALSEKAVNGVATLSASSATGASLEDPQWGGGVFTYSLIKGLEGEAKENPNAEWVTLSALENYLIKTITVLTNGQQKPKINGTLPGDIPLSKIK